MGFCGFDLQENHSVLMVKNQEMSPHRYSRRRGRVPFWNILTAFSITVTYSEWEKSRRALYHLGKDIFCQFQPHLTFLSCHGRKKVRNTCEVTDQMKIHNLCPL